jgi:hypothetical protein
MVTLKVNEMFILKTNEAGGNTKTAHDTAGAKAFSIGKPPNHPIPTPSAAFAYPHMTAAAQPQAVGTGTSQSAGVSSHVPLGPPLRDSRFMVTVGGSGNTVFTAGGNVRLDHRTCLPLNPAPNAGPPTLAAGADPDSVIDVMGNNNTTVVAQGDIIFE